MRGWFKNERFILPLVTVPLLLLVAACGGGEPEEPASITKARITVCNALNGDTDSDDWTKYECDRVADQLDAPTFEPKKKDFKVTIKIREKKCFRSAGCNVTYRIDPDL